MLDDKAKGEVSDVVEGFTLGKVSFTGGHVTNEIRDRLLWAGTFPHFDVSFEVRRLWHQVKDIFEGYSRTMVSMSDGQGVFVYHPSDVMPDAMSMYIDPLNYTTRLPESHFDTQVNDSDDDSDDTVKEFECHVDTRGYFHIPREATRAIGLTNGDGVVLESVLDDVLIRKASQGETPVASLQPVRGELRISDKAFIDEVGVWATVLNIKVANQTIVIS